MVNIGEICNREVIVALREMPVLEAAQLMRQHHVGTIVVCEPVNGEGRIPVGIVTDRDIVLEVVATELRADTITIGDIMSPALVTVAETAEVSEALELMRSKGVRRLPVVGAEGRLAGIVAVDDLVELLAEVLTDVAKVVAREQSREAATRR